MRRTLIVFCSGALVMGVPLVIAMQNPVDLGPEPIRVSRRPRPPVVSGRQYAVSSMKPQATEAAMRILDAGGNAFDAAVAGQAVLALVDPAMNGYGSDAEDAGLRREDQAGRLDQCGRARAAARDDRLVQAAPQRHAAGR